ncbi:response regulator [Planctomycetota bacterium]
MQPSKPLLLIEDDQVDARTVKRALQDIGVVDTIVHLTNGEEAMDYLRSGVNAKPCLILLDLNMPRMGGREFLEAAKQDATMCRIPIVVLTTSTNEDDIQETFTLGVAGYMVKPLDYDKFVDTIQAVSQYWSMSILPSQL